MNLIGELNDLDRLLISGKIPAGIRRKSHKLAKDTALGIGQGCRVAIANQTRFSITGLNYNDIRGKLESAMAELDKGIDILEPLSKEPG